MERSDAGEKRGNTRWNRGRRKLRKGRSVDVVKEGGVTWHIDGREDAAYRVRSEDVKEEEGAVT